MRRAILFSVALLAGCTPETPSAPSPATWTGTWRVLSVQQSGQITQPAPPGATYHLNFEGNRVSARVDCNTCVGPFSTRGRQITIGPTLACTRAACSTVAFEGVATTVLTGGHTAWVSGNSLTLESSRGVILLER